MKDSRREADHLKAETSRKSGPSVRTDDRLFNISDFRRRYFPAAYEEEILEDEVLAEGEDQNLDPATLIHKLSSRFVQR